MDYEHKIFLSNSKQLGLSKKRKKNIKIDLNVKGVLYTWPLCNL